jgi:hypothetical protein
VKKRTPVILSEAKDPYGSAIYEELQRSFATPRTTPSEVLDTFRSAYSGSPDTSRPGKSRRCNPLLATGKILLSERDPGLPALANHQPFNNLAVKREYYSLAESLLSLSLGRSEER